MVSMMRVAVPYGTLSSKQMRQLGMIADKYDRGYGHVTTRQNFQFNWPQLTDVPDLLQDLADVEMHGFQTSGNCIRNVTSDPYAGATAEEIEDPRFCGNGQRFIPNSPFCRVSLKSRLWPLRKIEQLSRRMILVSKLLRMIRERWVITFSSEAALDVRPSLARH